MVQLTLTFILVLCGMGFLQAEDVSYRLHRQEQWNRSQLPSPNLQLGEFKVAFWNFLVEFASEKEAAVYPKYSWTHRRSLVSGLIKRDAPDILGFCECNLIQAKHLASDLENEGYRLIGFSTKTLMTIEDVEREFDSGNEIWYGEFNGFIYQTKRMELLESKVQPLPMGQRHARILTQARFKDRVTGKEFVVFASHFDHMLPSSIEMSGQIEIECLKRLNDQGTPWFSIGDRNWPFNEQGERYAHAYVSCDFVREFRDETLLGHFGPSGTFPGHLWLEKYQPLPPVVDNSIAASTIDVGFRSKDHVIAVASYTLTGEFCPVSFTLLDEGTNGELNERNFASDHFYIGGIFRLP